MFVLGKDSTDEIKSRTKVIQREAPPTRFRIFFKQNESSESTQSSTSYSCQKHDVVLKYPDLCQRGLIISHEDMRPHRPTAAFTGTCRIRS